MADDTAKREGMGLIRFLVWAGAAFVAYRLLQNMFASPPSTLREKPKDTAGNPKPSGNDSVGAATTLVQDPQCLVYVDSQQAVRLQTPQGLLFFCGQDCARAYQKKHAQGA